MTNVTERIKEGSAKAIQYLENGDSVRRACQKAGISVTSLYHTTTPEQREQAYQKHGVGAVRTRGPGKRKKAFKLKRRTSAVNTADSTDVSELRDRLQQASEYISKLERKLIQTVVLNDNNH